jgi:hypothetical protein
MGTVGMSRRLAALGGSLALLALIIPAWWLDSSSYTAVATGIQALGVIVAVHIASVTLVGERRDRQVDRVLALHAELVTGELGVASTRLIGHLRKRGRDGKCVERVTLADLVSTGEISRYDGDIKNSPFHDANIVLRSGL